MAKVKFMIKNTFDTAEEVQTDTQGVLNTLTFENFQGVIGKYWNHCIHAQGDSFEEDVGKVELQLMWIEIKVSNSTLRWAIIF